MRYPLITALTLATATGQAATMNEFAQCALVPWATFSSSGILTAVGLTARDEGTIYWSYFDEDGDQLQNGSFFTDNNLLTGIALNQVLDPTLAGIDGFMLFCLDENEDGDIDDDDDAALAANAFYVNINANDVAYVPTLPVLYNNLDDSDPDDWNNSPVDSLPGAAFSDDDIYLQYLADGNPSGGDGTALVIFTTDEPDSQVNMLAAGPDALVNVPVRLPNSRVNVVIVEDIDDLANDPDLLPDGFLRWTVGDNVENAFAFSLVFSPAFGALQTLPGNLDIDP